MNVFFKIINKKKIKSLMQTTYLSHLEEDEKRTILQILTALLRVLLERKYYKVVVWHSSLKRTELLKIILSPKFWL